MPSSILVCVCTAQRFPPTPFSISLVQHIEMTQRSKATDRNFYFKRERETGPQILYL